MNTINIYFIMEMSLSRLSINTIENMSFLVMKQIVINSDI